MSLRNLASGPGFSVDIVYDDVAKTASGIQCTNNSGRDLTVWAIVGGTRRERVIPASTTQTFDFQVALSFSEPDLTSIGKPGKNGFRITAAEALGVST